VRSALALSLLAASSLASAERLITIPTGSKIPFGTARFESLWDPSRHGTSLNYLGIGVTTAFDVEIRTEEFPHGPTLGTFDVGYNVSSPISDLTPGISVGVLDAMNNTADGRRAYMALSYRTQVNGNVSPGTSIESTIGASFGHTTKVFVGASVPFTNNFRLLAEHNGDGINAGFEFRPAENLALRFLTEQQHTLVSVRYSMKF
jgi:hypothetical protein